MGVFDMFSSGSPWSGTDSGPNDVVLGAQNYEEPSPLGSMGSASFLQVIPEGDEEVSKETSKSSNKKRKTKKVRSPTEVALISSRDTDIALEERDFDKNPTILYGLLQGRAWEDAITRIDKCPAEARIWVYRRDSDGVRVRWRLLPLHAAIIFKGPVEVVESLLTVFPDAAKLVDDQKSLPIHLAYKRGASASTYRALLDSYHDCLNVKDAKGRTPRDLAKNGSGPRHVEFNYALKVHLAGRKQAREEVRAEEANFFKVKLEETRKSHKQTLEELRLKHRIEIKKMEERIKNLEADIAASRSASNTLDRNIAGLQSQLDLHQRTEQYLKGKLMGKIDYSGDSWKTSDAQKAMEGELRNLVTQITTLKEEIGKLLLEKEVLNKSLEAVVESTEWEKRKLEKKIKEQERTIESLKAEAQEAQAERARLQNELEQKKTKERDLVETIENLESQIKDQNEEEAVASKIQIEKLEQDREILHNENLRMTTQLKSISAFLIDMKDEHEGIVEKAALHERELELVSKEYKRILDHVEEQQKRDIEAQKQRFLLAKLLKAQEDEMKRNTKSRNMIKEAIAQQSRRIGKIGVHRKELMANCNTIGNNVDENIRGVVCATPHTVRGSYEQGTSDRDISSYDTSQSFQTCHSSDGATSSEEDLKLDNLSPTNLGMGTDPPDNHKSTSSSSEHAKTCTPRNRNEKPRRRNLWSLPSTASTNAQDEHQSKLSTIDPPSVRVRRGINLEKARERRKRLSRREKSRISVGVCHQKEERDAGQEPRQ